MGNPWIEDDLDKVRYQQHQRDMANARQALLVAEVNALGDAAQCVDCNYVQCSCSPEAPQSAGTTVIVDQPKSVGEWTSKKSFKLTELHYKINKRGVGCTAPSIAGRGKHYARAHDVIQHFDTEAEAKAWIEEQCAPK